MTTRHDSDDDGQSGYRNSVDNLIALAVSNANRRGIAIDVNAIAKILWWVKPFIEHTFDDALARIGHLLRLDLVTALSLGNVDAALRLLPDIRKVCVRGSVALTEPTTWPTPRILMN